MTTREFEANKPAADTCDFPTLAHTAEPGMATVDPWIMIIPVLALPNVSVTDEPEGSSPRVSLTARGSTAFAVVERSSARMLTRPEKS
jgi:hypothetical protein